MVYYANFQLSEKNTKFYRISYNLMELLGEVGGLIEMIGLLAVFLLIPFNYNLNKIMFLKDFVKKGDHQQMSKLSLSLKFMMHDLANSLNIKSCISKKLLQMQSQMDSITAQHFELTNSAKGNSGSNFMYDDNSDVVGISAKFTVDETVQIADLIDTIWDTYEKDDDEPITRDEAREFIEGYLGVFSPSE